MRGYIFILYIAVLGVLLFVTQPHRKSCGLLQGEQFCTGQQWVREGKGFVSSSFILFWFLGHKGGASSLFCHQPSSLSVMWICKGEDPSISVQPHQPWCKDCSICIGHAMSGAGVSYQSDGSNFMLSQKENKRQL